MAFTQARARFSGPQSCLSTPQPQSHNVLARVAKNQLGRRWLDALQNESWQTLAEDCLIRRLISSFGATQK